MKVEPFALSLSKGGTFLQPSKKKTVLRQAQHERVRGVLVLAHVAAASARSHPAARQRQRRVPDATGTSPASQ